MRTKRTTLLVFLLSLSLYFGVVSMASLCHAATSTYVNIPDATLRKAISKALGESRAADARITDRHHVSIKCFLCRSDLRIAMHLVVN